MNLFDTLTLPNGSTIPNRLAKPPWRRTWPMPRRPPPNA